VTDFAWRGIDEQGQERRGRLTAANENEARVRLEKRRMYVLDLAEGQGDPSPQGNGVAPKAARKRALRLTARALFTRQLATLVQVTPVSDALSTIVRQTGRASARNVIGNVHAGVMAGERLPEAMAREAKSFSPLYRAVVAAGDASGTLPDALERLADEEERQAAFRSRIITALAYPAVLALVAVLVVIALMVFVVPAMVEQFDTVGQQLPFLTRAVIFISTVLAKGWWVILMAIAAISFLSFRALRHAPTRERFDGWLLRVPIIGNAIAQVTAASFARNLATMVSARLPLVEGLTLARDTISNRVIRSDVSAMADNIRAGQSLSSAMAAGGRFPPLLVYLTASGESAGRLDLMLSQAASYLEREFDARTATFLALLEPLVIVIMGLVVALIVLSVLLPILQLESLVAI
jgi:general secretion pathway protein F